MSYSVLARKYRPQNLEQLVGQENLVESLKNAFDLGRIPHAILLHGIRGVGKTTTARIIAKSLNCLGSSGNLTVPQITPCDVCLSCLGVLTDRHMDVVEIDAASHTGVDDMRELTEFSRYKAVQGRFKIFIIDEVHMLSKSAFNALLKTLEEPPAHVKFIFATTEIKKIPDTILSRCLRFNLAVMQPLKIVEHLQNVLQQEGLGADMDALAIIARSADGSMRDALSLLDQAIMLSGSQIVSANMVQEMLGFSNHDSLFEIFEFVFQGNVEKAINNLHCIYDVGGNPLLITQDFINILYWLICIKNFPSITKDAAWPEVDRLRGLQLADLLPISVLLQSWDLMQKAYDDVRNSYQPAQALDIALMRLAFIKDVLTGPLTVSEKNLGSVANVATSHSLMPQTFEAMTELFLHAKEGLLHGHLLHDLHLISYVPGKIVCGLGVRAPKNFARLLKDACERITQQPWEVEILPETLAPTITQARAIKMENLKQAALDHPLIKEILQSFPDAEITIN